MQPLPYTTEGALLVWIQAVVPPLTHQSLEAESGALAALLRPERAASFRVVRLQPLVELELVLERKEGPEWLVPFWPSERSAQAFSTQWLRWRWWSALLLKSGVGLLQRIVERAQSQSLLARETLPVLVQPR